ncbi:hypothetical protein [Pragia fontium]|uniref:hypothetical protein n=1 Tax=Pragia fontium TaxID=82985 RepID=UPI000F7194D0|nr:hypothetical protein [Pragia fontium]VEJ54442.1 Uncharacterised protein [Pragia fontium]
MKGNGHFWPAYVDMMTVLLLVYLLISMIFQVLLIVAQQNVGVKLSAQQQVEIHAVPQGSKLNELRMMLDVNQNYLGSKNKKELISWLEKYKDDIEKNGVVIYAASKEGKQIGVNLTLQYDRCLEVLRTMQQYEISTQKVTINNSSVNIFPEDFAAIYLKSPSDVPVKNDEMSTSDRAGNPALVGGV